MDIRKAFDMFDNEPAPEASAEVQARWEIEDRIGIPLQAVSPDPYFKDPAGVALYVTGPLKGRGQGIAFVWINKPLTTAGAGRWFWRELVKRITAADLNLRACESVYAGFPKLGSFEIVRIDSR